MGPDALNELPDAKALWERLRTRKSVLKTLLLNQQVVAGIGNIYSDEILWRARLDPDHTPVMLTKPALRRLYEAIGAVLNDAIEHRGSSLADQQYVDLYGRVGDAQRLHDVHAREGQPCPRCGRPIRRRTPGGRSAYSCPHCQR